MEEQSEPTTLPERDRPEIEVTPAMVEAGALALEAHDEVSPTYLAEVAFRAMMQVAIAQGVYRLGDQNCRSSPGYAITFSTPSGRRHWVE